MVEVSETRVFVALKNMQSKSSREKLKMSLWKNNENSRKSRRDGV